jgi:hypothetical protein
LLFRVEKMPPGAATADTSSGSDGNAASGSGGGTADANANVEGSTAPAAVFAVPAQFADTSDGSGVVVMDDSRKKKKSKAAADSNGSAAAAHHTSMPASSVPTAEQLLTWEKLSPAEFQQLQDFAACK